MDNWQKQLGRQSVGAVIFFTENQKIIANVQFASKSWLTTKLRIDNGGRNFGVCRHIHYTAQEVYKEIVLGKWDLFVYFYISISTIIVALKSLNSLITTCNRYPKVLIKLQINYSEKRIKLSKHAFIVLYASFSVFVFFQVSNNFTPSNLEVM